MKILVVQSDEVSMYNYGGSQRIINDERVDNDEGVTRKSEFSTIQYVKEIRLPNSELSGLLGEGTMMTCKI